MLLRYSLLTIAFLVSNGSVVLHAQQDAQDRTQAFFDNHKEADVIDPGRGLKDKAKQSPEVVRESTLPPLTGLSEKERKEMGGLVRDRDNFVAKKVKEETKIAEKTVGLRAAKQETAQMTIQAVKEWGKKDEQAANRLKYLQQKSSLKTKGSNSALPELKY